jgi:hypothetical protein
MNNHCVNILRFKDPKPGSNIENTFKDFLENYPTDSKSSSDSHNSIHDFASRFRDQKWLNFHKIIEMPKDLRNSMRPLEKACEDPKTTAKKIKYLEKCIRARNLEDYGYETPEDWADENWGTEFNSYEYFPDKQKNSLCFDTANTPPLPVIQKLAELTKTELTLSFAEPAAGIYGQMTAYPTGECEFKDFAPDKIPKEFQNEFPNSLPPLKTHIEKPKKPSKQKNPSNKNKKDLMMDN